MIKIRSLILASALASVTLNLSANTVSSYDDFVNSIQEGLSFTIISNFSQCTGQPGQPIGYFAPKDFMLIPAGSNLPQQIATSDLHFTNATGTPVYEYVDYVFYPNNSVKIETTDYNPQTFAATNSHTFTCQLNNGIQVNTH